MRNLIVEKMTVLLLPFIEIYGLYIMLNGHHSAGGGFAGGAVMGAGIILYVIVFGEEGKKKIPVKMVVILQSFGALIYIVLGFVGIFKGGNFLSNGAISLKLGSYLEIGIGLVVACTVVSLFYALLEEA